jgi:hypothetical protein
MRLCSVAVTDSLLPVACARNANGSGPLKDVHIAVGVLSLALAAATALLGVWCWWRAQQTPWFWHLLRAMQLVAVLEAVLGGVLQRTGRHAPSLHIIYGVLPVLVSFLAEQLRIASAQMILDSRGFASAQEVGELPDDEQRAVVVAILQRELGVMTLAAIVIVVLLARAAGTA